MGPSPRRRPEICHASGKVRHASEEAALAQLAKRRTRGTWDALASGHAYRCDLCRGGWHLTQGTP